MSEEWLWYLPEFDTSGTDLLQNNLLHFIRLMTKNPF